MAAARRDGQTQQSLRLKVMEAGSRTKTRGVLVCDPPAVCSSPRGAEDECSVLGPHLPLISPPSVSSSACPAVFPALQSVFSCFLFVVAFNNVRLYNRKRRSDQTNIQTLYVTLNVLVCVDQPCMCEYSWQLWPYIFVSSKMHWISSLEVQETQRTIIIYFLRHLFGGFVTL